jgi:hypothetical protein
MNNRWRDPLVPPPIIGDDDDQPSVVVGPILDQVPPLEADVDSDSSDEEDDEMPSLVPRPLLDTEEEEKDTLNLDRKGSSDRRLRGGGESDCSFMEDCSSATPDQDFDPDWKSKATSKRKRAKNRSSRAATARGRKTKPKVSAVAPPPGADQVANGQAGADQVANGQAGSTNTRSASQRSRRVLPTHKKKAPFAAVDTGVDTADISYTVAPTPKDVEWFTYYCEAIRGVHDAYDCLQQLLLNMSLQPEAAKIFVEKVLGCELPPGRNPVQVFEIVVMNRDLGRISTNTEGKTGNSKKRAQKQAALCGTMKDFATVYDLSSILYTFDNQSQEAAKGALSAAHVFELFGLDSKHGCAVSKLPGWAEGSGSLQSFCESHSATASFLFELESHYKEKLESGKTILNGDETNKVELFSKHMKPTSTEFRDILSLAKMTVAKKQWAELSSGESLPAKPEGFDLATMNHKVRMAAAVVTPITMRRLFGGPNPAPFDLTSKAGKDLTAHLGVEPAMPRPFSEQQTSVMDFEDPDSTDFKADPTVYDDVPSYEVCVFDNNKNEPPEGGGPCITGQPTVIGINNFLSRETANALRHLYLETDEVEFQQTPTSPKTFTRAFVKMPCGPKQPYNPLKIKVGKGNFVQSFHPNVPEEILMKLVGELLDELIGDVRVLLLSWGAPYHLVEPEYFSHYVPRNELPEDQEEAKNLMKMVNHGDCEKQVPNGGILKVGYDSVYWPHTDLSHMMCDNEKHKRRKFAHSGRAIPTQDSLIVGTLVLADHNRPNASIVWSGEGREEMMKYSTTYPKRGTSNKDKWMKKHPGAKAALQTAGCASAHIQFVGANAPEYMHFSKNIGGRWGIFTFRSFITWEDPQCVRCNQLDGLTQSTAESTMQREVYTKILAGGSGLLVSKLDPYRPRKSMGWGALGGYGFPVGPVGGGLPGAAAAAGGGGGGGTGLAGTGTLAAEFPGAKVPLPKRKVVQTGYRQVAKEKLDLLYNIDTCPLGVAPVQRTLAEAMVKGNYNSAFERLGNHNISIPALMEDKVVFQRELRGGKKVDSLMLHPNLELPFYPGQDTTRANMIQHFPFTKQTNTVLLDNAVAANGICLQHLYKSFAASVKESNEQGADFVKAMTKLLYNKVVEDPSLLDKPLVIEGELLSFCNEFVFKDIVMYGFGGSSETAGAFAGDADTMRPQDATVVAPENQHGGKGDSGNRNDVLERNANSERVCATFFNHASYGRYSSSEAIDKANESMYCLGNTYICDYSEVPGIKFDDNEEMDDNVMERILPYFQGEGITTESAIEKAKLYFKKERVNFTFLQRKHRKATLRHAMTTRQYVEVYWMNLVKEMRPNTVSPIKRIYIPTKKIDNLVVKVPSDKFPRHSSGKLIGQLKLSPDRQTDEVIVEIYGKAKLWKEDLAEFLAPQKKKRSAPEQGEECGGDETTTEETQEEPSTEEDEEDQAWKADQYRVTLSQFEAIIASVFAAGAARNNESWSLTPGEKGEKLATILCHKFSHLLQSGLRTKCMPMPQRGLDIGTLFFKYHAVTALNGEEPTDDMVETPRQLVEDEDNPGQLTKECQEEVNRSLFMAILWELTAMTAHFDNFRRSKDELSEREAAENEAESQAAQVAEFQAIQDSLATKGISSIPSTMEELRIFRRYLKEVVMERNTERMTSIVSRQHDKVLDDEWKDWVHLDQLLDQAGEMLLGHTKSVLGLSHKKRRGENLHQLSKALYTFKNRCEPPVGNATANKTLEKFSKVSHFMIADTEEIFDQPFGQALDATDVMPAFGGIQGVKITRPVWEGRELRNGGKKKEDEMRAKLKGRGVSGSMIETLIGLQKFHEARVEGLHKKSGDEVFLKSQGVWKRFVPDGENIPPDDITYGADADGRRYQLMVLGCNRPYSIVDTEHELCKIWIACIGAHPSRTTANNPRAAEPHCHPPYYKEGDITKWFERVKPHLESLWDAYVVCRTRRTLTMHFPSLLLRHGEVHYDGRQPWQECYHKVFPEAQINGYVKPLTPDESSTEQQHEPAQLQLQPVTQSQENQPPYDFDEINVDASMDIDESMNRVFGTLEEEGVIVGRENVEH